MLTALGARTPSPRGRRERAPAAGVRPDGAEPLRGPPAHLRVGRRARDGRGQLRAPRGGAAPARSTRALVFAFAARAGFSHAAREGRRATSRSISATSPPGEVERLVALRLGVETAPDELLRFVRARAGGHPLFVEEVIKGLVDVGAITVADRRVVSMKLVGQDLALPKTLRGLVASRVARLAPADRATLQAAAVLGDPIDVNVLSSMLGQAMPALERSVATLKERDFVVDRGPAGWASARPSSRRSSPTR